MMAHRFAFATVLSLAAASATTVKANTCSWWSPYDRLTYSGINVTTHGGGSISSSTSPMVVLDFWGKSWTNRQSTMSAIGANIQTMLQDRSFWSRYGQYGVTSGSMYPTVFWNFKSLTRGSASNGDLTSADIQNNIQSDIGSGAIPFGTPVINLIFLPAGLHWNLTCGAGCGRHSSFPYSAPPLINTTVVFAVVEEGDVNQNTFTTAHEIMEATTDPNPSLSTSAQNGTGWYSTQPTSTADNTPTSPEIGDLCNARAEVVNGISWQQSWLQDQCRCDGDGTPGVFWGQNYGYTGAPIGDWASGSFKGQCAPGQPVTGISENTSETLGHSVLCGNGPGYAARYPQGSSCRALHFDHGLPGYPGNNPDPWPYTDWQNGEYKAQCAQNEYVAGVSQTTSGKVDGILCCPGNVSGNSCDVEQFYGGNSSSYSAPDWDNGYFKGECASGKYVAGISAVAENGGVHAGAAFSLRCCSP